MTTTKVFLCCADSPHSTDSMCLIHLMDSLHEEFHLNVWVNGAAANVRTLRSFARVSVNTGE